MPHQHPLPILYYFGLCVEVCLFLKSEETDEATREQLLEDVAEEVINHNVDFSKYPILYLSLVQCHELLRRHHEPFIQEFRVKSPSKAEWVLTLPQPVQDVTYTPDGSIQVTYAEMDNPLNNGKVCIPTPPIPNLSISHQPIVRGVVISVEHQPT